MAEPTVDSIELVRAETEGEILKVHCIATISEDEEVRMILHRSRS
jgi:hypothetical protein